MFIIKTACIETVQENSFRFSKHITLLKMSTTTNWVKYGAVQRLMFVFLNILPLVSHEDQEEQCLSVS